MSAHYAASIIRFAVVGLALFASAQAASCQASDLCGKWKGIWHGCTDGLEGTCNARITRCDAHHYHAVFWGRAFKVMPYRYTVVFKAWKDPATGKVHFKSKKKLPIWGWYWVRGTVCGCNFFANYNTDDHVGYFKMRKVSN